MARLVCLICSKPNALGSAACTGCGSKKLKEEEENEEGCIFCGIEENKEENIRFLDNEIVVFDAKFNFGFIQLNVIPRKHVKDIKEWRNKGKSQQVMDLLVKMKTTISNKIMPEIFNEKGMDKNHPYYCGFNYPPSINHLHMYVVSPPMKTKELKETFGLFPRWYTFKQILRYVENDEFFFNENRPLAEKNELEEELKEVVEKHFEIWEDDVKIRSFWPK